MATLWASTHRPASEAELVVTKKRVAEVKDFLTGNLGPSKRTLVLRGPPGCGKAAVLRALCRDYGFEVAEWDPVARGAIRGGAEPLIDAFFRFLAQADRYCTLCSDGRSAVAAVPKPRVTLVRDFPFTLLEQNSFDPARPAQFVERFTALMKSGQVRRAVFCFNDTFEDYKVVNRLFLQADADAFATIHFDGVAKTFAQRALDAVLRAEGIDASAVDTSSLAVECNGDLRHALNALQLAAGALPRNTGAAEAHGTSQKRGRGRGASRGRGRAAMPTTQNGDAPGTPDALLDIAPQIGASDSGLRPASMDMFHALGRLLYCKRVPPESFEPASASQPAKRPRKTASSAAPGAAEPKQLPHELLFPKCSRPPLYFVPEEVLNSTNKEPATIVDWVFTNSPRFCSDIGDLADFSRKLAEVDAWGVRGSRFGSMEATATSLDEFAAGVQVRSFLDSNLHPVPPSFVDPCGARHEAELPGSATFNMARPLMADVWRHRDRRLDELNVHLERAGPWALGSRHASQAMVTTTLPLAHFMLWSSQGQHPRLRFLPHALMMLMMDLSGPIDSDVLRRGAGEGLVHGGDAADDVTEVVPWNSGLDEDPIED